MTPTMPIHGRIAESLSLCSLNPPRIGRRGPAGRRPYGQTASRALPLERRSGAHGNSIQRHVLRSHDRQIGSPSLRLSISANRVPRLPVAMCMIMTTCPDWLLLTSGVSTRAVRMRIAAIRTTVTLRSIRLHQDSNRSSNAPGADCASGEYYGSVQ